tara:strand:+ start:5330 stop:6214 length:885 start_codon:yes stop_codon:yes gene_type:complete
VSRNQQIRSEITNQIISALESGTLAWRKPWSSDRNCGMPKNVVSGDLYSGVNPLLLGLASERHGFQSRHWGTYKQWSELGGKVMRRPSHVPSGQWGTKIVFCKPVTKKQNDHDEPEETYFLLRTYTVFNIDQVEGDHLDYLRVGYSTDTCNSESNTFDEADELIEATEADIRHGGNQAYYDIPGDYIQVPNRDQFAGSAYYEVLFHEIVHWTEKRLNWDRNNNGYALGELIAEIGACYICSELNIPMNDENHHAYLDGWLKKMKQDSSFIFKASSQASKAADYIMSFKPVEVSC